MPESTEDIIDQIVALIRKIEANAHARGSEEVLARILAAASPGKMHEGTNAERAEKDNLQQVTRRRPGGQPGMKRATRGSVRKYVDRVLSDPNYQGATYDGIVAAVVQFGGTDIAPASVRNYLRSSEKRGEMRRQNDLWFLSRPPWARAEENPPTEPATD